MPARRPIHIILIAVAGMMLTAGTFAQMAKDTIRLREIEVVRSLSHKDVLAIRSSVDSSSLALTSSMNLTQLLANHSSIFIRRTGRGSLATAAFRGTDGAHTQVFWNGMELNSAMNGQVDLSLIPVFFLDEVELYHGGSSLIHSSGALGGSVLLNSKPDWNGRSGGRLVQEAASFNTWNIMGRIWANQGGWHLNTRLFHNYSENNYKYMNRSVIPHREIRVQNASYRRHGILQEAYKRINDKNILSARIWLQQARRNLPPAASYEGNHRNEYQDDESARLALSWQKYYGRGKLVVYTGTSLNRLDYHLHTSDFDHANYDSESREITLYQTAEHEHQVSEKLKLKSQLRFTHNRVRNHEEVTMEGYTGQRSMVSAMTSIYRQVGKNAGAWMMIREDLHDRTCSPLMPSAGFNLSIPGIRGIQMKATLSRNFRKPGLNDLYWIPGGNPGLKPEHGYSSDLSLVIRREINRTRFDLDGTFFYTDIKDWIIWTPTVFRYWQADNLRHVLTRGFEGRLKSTLDLSRITMSVSIDYIHTRATDQATGRQLIYLPRHAANAGLSLSGNGYFLNYHLSCSGERHTQAGGEQKDFEIILNPFLVHDLTAGKEFTIFKQQFLCQASIRNLLDEEYQMVFARPMPRRNYSLILKYRF